MNAKTGDKLTLRARKRLANLSGCPLDMIPTEVIAPSSETHGQWVCIDCGEPFRNNWGATSHEHEPGCSKHRLAWRTIHGFEQA